MVGIVDSPSGQMIAGKLPGAGMPAFSPRAGNSLEKHYFISMS
jgi:hypothetical protein